MNSFNDPLRNEEAEQGLLGSLMIENSMLWRVLGIVQPEDFYAPVHSEIFTKICELVQAARSATPVTLWQSFTNHVELEHVGGSGYLAALAAGVISIVNCEDYARLIADLAQRRRLIQLMEEHRQRLLSTDTPAAEITAQLASAITENSGRSWYIKTKREVAGDAVDAIQLPPDCYSTGLHCLDRVMGGGLYAGFTYGFAGAEKRGKTTLAHTISQNLNDEGNLHAYIALEMGSIQIEQRNLARTIGVNSLKFLQKSARDDVHMLADLARHATSCKDNTLYLDMPGADLGQIQVELARLVSKHKIKGFILDYWQLVEGQQKGETEERHLRRVAQWVANFARRHKVWAILLSQVNAEGDTFGGKGLVKACDQLYTIELASTETKEQEIWLKMTHSRYTMLADVGSAAVPQLYISKKAGPHVAELYAQEPVKTASLFG